jgi:iron complex transport system substrate-binding protein
MAVSIVSLQPNALSDVYDDIGRVSAALGVETEGEALVAAMKDRATAIADKAAGLSAKPRVACIEWTEPLMAAGNWVPEQINLAGGIDPFGLAARHSPVLDWDDLVAAKPDVVIFMPCGYDLARTRTDAEAFASRPGFADLPAVRAGRVYVTNGSDFFNRPGPRLAESLEIMAEILHPGAFAFGHQGVVWEPLS